MRKYAGLSSSAKSLLVRTFSLYVWFENLFWCGGGCLVVFPCACRGHAVSGFWGKNFSGLLSWKQSSSERSIFVLKHRSTGFLIIMRNHYQEFALLEEITSFKETMSPESFFFFQLSSALGLESSTNFHLWDNKSLVIWKESFEP